MPLFNEGGVKAGFSLNGFSVAIEKQLTPDATIRIGGTKKFDGNVEAGALFKIRF